MKITGLKRNTTAVLALITIMLTTGCASILPEYSNESEKVSPAAKFFDSFVKNKEQAHTTPDTPYSNPNYISGLTEQDREKEYRENTAGDKADLIFILLAVGLIAGGLIGYNSLPKHDNYLGDIRWIGGLAGAALGGTAGEGIFCMLQIGNSINKKALDRGDRTPH